MIDMKDKILAITDKLVQAANSCGRDPESVILMGVSKFKNAQLVEKGIDAGLTHLGENYIQEAVDKIKTLKNKNVCWHFIGHLQSNKAKFAVEYFDYIHTVDSVKLAREINKQAGKFNKIQKILIQVHIGDEDTKAGVNPENVMELIKEISDFENLQINGLMCMPPYCNDPEEVRPYFRQLAQIRDEIKKLNLSRVQMDHLSMGMSHDFGVAVSEGATIVRVGRAIFGER